MDFDGDTLVTGSYDKTLKVWSIKKSDVKCTLRGHSNWLSCVQLNAATQSVISGGWDAQIKLWHYETDPLPPVVVEADVKQPIVAGGAAGAAVAGPGAASSAGAGAGAGAGAAAAGGMGRGNRCVATLATEDAGDAVYCCRWDVKSNRVLSGGRRMAVHEWDLNTQQLTQNLMGHTKQVRTRV
jgi:WD40 repeat protein